MVNIGNIMDRPFCERLKMSKEFSILKDYEFPYHMD